MPGEFAPLGFNAWINTWLWRFRDVYPVTWKLDVEAISMSDIPASAFDSPEQRARVADIFDDYNDTLTWERGQDAAFGEIARERRSRHPLRTYLKIPFLRSLTIWFTPRVELLPFSGNLWPLRRGMAGRPPRFPGHAHSGLGELDLHRVGAGGAWIARRSPGVAFLVVFILVRTVYFCTFADEAPEPRYVLECFPAVIALGAQVFRGALWRPLRLYTPVLR